MYYISCKNLGISYISAMSKIDKDLKELDKKLDKFTKQANQKIEKYQYGDWKAVAELDDFEISLEQAAYLVDLQRK